MVHVLICTTTGIGTIQNAMHSYRLGNFGMLSAFLLAFSAASSFGEQVPLQLNTASPSPKGAILSSDFYAFVEELRINTSIPGISVGAVRLSGDGKPPQVELASWGRKTEEGDGHDLTPDVSSPPHALCRTMLTDET